MMAERRPAICRRTPAPLHLSPEGRLVERAQLARMQALAAMPQDLERREADLEMLADRAVVEARCGARQLDLAVQRLVGDAEQRAVRHAQPKSLRRDRARFHVDRYGARDVDAPTLLA